MTNIPIVIAHNNPIAAPLKALWRWLMAQPGQLQHLTHDGVRPTHACGAASRKQVSPAQPCINSHSVLPSRPLRVLQVRESGLSSAQTGRIRISGRMADVCAELDRLAACEARLH